MALTKKALVKGLLQYNFFPLSKKKRDDIPPVFSSSSLTYEVGRQLLKCHQNKEGHDTVEYRLARFNGVLRICEIPHPLPYVHLVFNLASNLSKINYVLDNKLSMVRPENHKDGRVIIMDYERPFQKTGRLLDASFGCRFIVHTDIAHCFPSIYSHAVPWALVGIDEAKRTQNNKALWYNKLDKNIMGLKRRETSGVPIGSGLSNIISEIILAKVDGVLAKKYKYHRFIDDYRCYAKTEEAAQEFLLDLSKELSIYKLQLNINKTEILPLPQPINGRWIPELASSLPRGMVNIYAAMNYLSHAVDLSKVYPNESVLKYAFRTISRKKLNSEAKLAVLGLALSLSFFTPPILSVVEDLVDYASQYGKSAWKTQLKKVLIESIRLRRSDAVAWCMYYINKHKVPIPNNIIKKIIDSGDCVAITLLARSKNETAQRDAIEFAESLSSRNNHDKDQYWLLLYTLFNDSKIKNMDKTGAFKILKKNKVTFVE